MDAKTKKNPYSDLHTALDDGNDVDDAGFEFKELSPTLFTTPCDMTPLNVLNYIYRLKSTPKRESLPQNPFNMSVAATTGHCSSWKEN
jgi:hypothetical protein